MTLITYDGRAVAMAATDHLYLASHVDRLANGHPLKRFVCFLALYARDVQIGLLPGDPGWYLPRRGERYAREALIPADEFAAVAHLADRELAARFGVPVEQIAKRREDLHARRARSAGPRPRRRAK